MSKFDEVRIHVGRLSLYAAGIPLLALVIEVFTPDTSGRTTDQEILLGAMGMFLITSLFALGVGGRLRIAISKLLHIAADAPPTGKPKKPRPPIKSPDDVIVPPASPTTAPGQVRRAEGD